MCPETDLIALPMHGEVKLRNEGYRTRDGHVLEWIEKLRPGLDVTVRSRPEPFPRISLARRHGRANPAWDWQTPQPLTLPSLQSRRQWWVKSLRYEPTDEVLCRGAVIWNPIAGSHLLGRTLKADRVVVDLLDDWSVHIAFQPIRKEVELAYGRIFDLADAVTANSEGTVALAARFGREAELMTNGCDPDQFEAAGDRRRVDGPLTIGYVGKLSERLDLELIEGVVRQLPEVTFEISGPYCGADRAANKEIRRSLQRHPNVKLGGNVPYEELPSRIASWDIGWVPHRTGAGEVGGDVIKTYEYRATSLPVVSTPIIGADRALPGVTIAGNVEETVAAFRGLFGPDGATRPPRIPIQLDPATTWRSKTERILELLQL